MKIREDYEYRGWRRLVHWVNGDVMDKPQNVMSRDFIKNESEVQQEREHRIQNSFMKVKQYVLKNSESWYNRFYSVLAILVALAVISVLLMTVMELPEFGNPLNPANNEVVDRYVESGLQETGAINIVAGMILDYRAFDTLGESHVLFIAVSCVLILLRMDYDKDGKVKEDSGIHDEGYDRKYEPRNDIILQITTCVLFPMIVLYGIYVILNGHLSAGGGFSGGAIIGAGLILYNNAFGFKKTKKFFTYNTFKWVSFVSLISYALLKTYSFYTGANHIESNIPLGEAGTILSSGLILPLNICVGCVVACTMYTFFTMFRKGGM